MKNKILLPFVFVMGIAFTAIISWKDNQDKKTVTQVKNISNSENRPILAIRKIKLKEGVTAESFEKFAIKAKNGDYCKLPGVKIYFGKGERGDEPDTYLYFLEFDSKLTRDFYAPDADNANSPKTGPDAKKLLDSYVNNFMMEFNKLADFQMNGKKGYTDYIILE
jgi:hypothetical protein